MPRLPKLALVLTILILLSIAAPSINAVTTLIGSGNDVSRYAFGLDPGAASAAFPDFAAGGTYQQVYASNAFSGPVTITQIAFASNARLTSGPGTANYNFNLALSTTAVGPNGLSTNLAANRGANPVQVFSGPLTATITDSDQFDVIVNITPFTYDPASGNLLMEVVFNSPTQFTGGSVLYFNAGFNSSTSRAANPSGGAGGAFTDGFGLQTRFTTKGAAQITLGNLQQTFDGSPKSVAVTTDPPGLGVDVTYDGSAQPPTNAGSYAVAAIINDPNFIGQTSGNLIVGKADQQITFDALPNKTLADPDFNVIATASSNLAVSFAASGNCTLNGAQVHLTGTGTCTITASQDGNANINAAAPVSRTFSTGKADQQITFDALADKTFGDDDFNIGATASSNLSVAFSATGNCTVSGTQVHITGAGSCTITASQDGDANINAAATVARTFSIGKADQQITFNALADRKFGDADFSVSAASSSNLAVSFAANGDCTLNGAQVHLTGAGTCTTTASQPGDTNHNAANPVSQSFTISKATAVITLDNLAQSYDGTPKSATAVTNPAGLSVTLTYNQNNAPVTSPTDAGSYEVKAIVDDANFEGSASGTLVISKATPTINWNNPSDITYGTALSATQLNAVASVAGISVYTPAAGQILHAGNNQTLHVDFTPTDTANYNSVSKDVAINVLQKALTVTAEDKTRAFGAADPQLTYTMTGFVNNDTQASATTGQPALTTAATATSDVGLYPIKASVGTLNSNDYSFSFADGTLTVTKADQSITFGALANKRFGDAPFAVSATVEASGNALSFSSQTPAVCSVAGNTVSILAVGTCTIRASQTGGSNHNAAADVDQSFDIAKAVTTTTLASSINPSTLGQAVTFTATVTSAGGIPTGTVQFIIDGVPQGKARALNSLGIAGGSTSDLTAGKHTVTADYLGDDNFASSNGALTVDQTVNITTSININDVALAEGDSGTKSFDFTVTLSQPSNLELKVDFATTDSTAKAGVDYQASSGTLIFAPGELTRTITVLVNGNTIDEPNKTFFINLTNPQNATLSDAQGAGTIINDDAASLQLSSNIYSAAEDAGRATINVTRTGDLSGAASVQYETSDLAGLNNCNVNTGDASARCDYTAVGGTLSFLAGESSKTFTVPIINDVYVEGPEVLTITLNNSVGAVSGTPLVAAVTIIDDDGVAGAANPIDQREFFVRQLYLDILNREPEPGGFAAWLDRLNTCPRPGETLEKCDEIAVASDFFRSPEFFDRAYFLYKFYEAALGRQPQFDEYQHDLRRLTGFLTEDELEQRKREFAEEFVNRTEFRTLYDPFGSGQPFVDAVLTRVGAGRPGVEAAAVVSSNRQSVIDRLAANQITRAQGLRELMESAEVSQRFFNKAFVVVGYFAFLRRDPDISYLVWINMLNTTGDYREMIRGFMQSQEYRLRFGPI